MPVRMRLQRHGKKNAPFYHIVVADGRAPRDGKFIEKLGTYNPMKNPAEIEISIDKAVTWLQNGAQPSDTVRCILSYKGVLLKKHLQGGVTKGALTQEQADAKFAKWLQEKEAKVQGKRSDLSAKERAEIKAKLEAEEKANKEKAEAIAKKKEVKVEEAPTEEVASEETAPAAEEVTSEETAPAAEETETPATEEA